MLLVVVVVTLTILTNIVTNLLTCGVSSLCVGFKQQSEMFVFLFHIFFFNFKFYK